MSVNTCNTDIEQINKAGIKEISATEFKDDILQMVLILKDGSKVLITPRGGGMWPLKLVFNFDK
jgi:hypothetical protein